MKILEIGKYIWYNKNTLISEKRLLIIMQNKSILHQTLKFWRKKNSDIKAKREIDRQINLYSNCIDCDFKNVESIGKEELSDLLKSLKCTQNNDIVLFEF